MKALLDQNGYDRKPHVFRKPKDPTSTDSWYYEESVGIHVYCVNLKGTFVGTISWKSLRASLARHERARKKKNKRNKKAKK